MPSSASSLGPGQTAPPPPFFFAFFFAPFLLSLASTAASRTAATFSRSLIKLGGPDEGEALGRATTRRSEGRQGVISSAVIEAGDDIGDAIRTRPAPRSAVGDGHSAALRSSGGSGRDFDAAAAMMICCIVIGVTVGDGGSGAHDGSGVSLNKPRRTSCARGLAAWASWSTVVGCGCLGVQQASVGCSERPLECGDGAACGVGASFSHSPNTCSKSTSLSSRYSLCASTMSRAQASAPRAARSLTGITRLRNRPSSCSRV
mmetsp:Transcript_20803/g.51194  ORF Transcript_20803/g.51194 Transcript_20803/m.51194 type:complete len:260 (-) Transcript_20803:109-888(-)